jgi:hypothetical protein
MGEIERLKKRNEQLDQRVAALEDLIDTQKQSATVSRRAMLGVGAAGLGLGGLATSNAGAATNQVGTIGSQNDRVDIFAEDIDATNIISPSAPYESTSFSFSGFPFTLNLDQGIYIFSLQKFYSTNATGNSIEISDTSGIVAEVDFFDGSRARNFDSSPISILTTGGEFKTATMFGNLTVSQRGNHIFAGSCAGRDLTNKITGLVTSGDLKIDSTEPNRGPDNVKIAKIK